MFQHEEKEILKYFNLYYYFAQLTQNVHEIKHTFKSLKNKTILLKEIENFYKKANEDKHVNKKIIDIEINKHGEKILKIKPSEQLRNYVRNNIASNKPYLNEYNFKKLINEHKEKIEHLKDNNEILKYFLENNILSFKQKFILAINTLNLTIITKDSKIRTFVYPLEYIELDEYNSAVLTGIPLSKNTTKDKKQIYLLQDEYIEINLNNLPIVKNEFIFNTFLPNFPKEKPKEKDEEEYPTLNFLINKEIEKIELTDIEKFLQERSKKLKKYLIKPKDDFIERVDIPLSILNSEQGLILFEEVQESNINFDLIINDKLSISNPLKAYIQIDFDKKVHYQNNFSDDFIPYYGTNTKEYPLAKGQSEVLENYVKKQSLIAVIGAPGTGKTTLFKSIIANNITARALNIIFNNQDYNNMMLMTSTARKAVDNVIKDIEDENPFMGALVLLSKEDAQQNNRRALALSQFLRPIKEVYEENIFNSKKFIEFIKGNYGENIENTKDTFLDAYEKYQKYQTKNLINEFKEIYPFLEKYSKNLINSEMIKNLIKETKKYIDDLIILYKNKNELKDNISDLKQKLKELKLETQPFINKVSFLIDRFEGEIEENKKINELKLIEEYYDFFLGKDLTFLLDEFEYSYNQIKSAGFIGKLLNNFLKKEEKLFKDFKKRFKLSYLSNSEFLETLEEIKIVRKQYNTYLKKTNVIKNLNKKLSLQEKLKNIQENANISKEKIFEYSSINEFYRLTPQIYKANYLLYKLSESFLILEAYEKINKEELASKLSELKDILELNNFNKISKEEIMQNLIISSRFFPVIGATNKKINIIYSNTKKIKNTKNANHAKFYHTILIDEAGMIPSSDAIHSINIGQQALIVGDPKQLEPIPEIPDILVSEFERYIKKQNIRYEKYNKIFSPIKFSAYDIASGISILKFQDEKSKDFIGKAYLLDEHRRCQKDIAELFVKVADYPKDLKIKTNIDTPKFLLKHKNQIKYLEFYDCKLTEKPSIKNTNPLEIEAIEFILKDLEKRGIDISSQVGIITPFLNQASELINRFGDRLGHTNNKQKIGTVHKFQGAEFDVIIFSSVVNPYNKAIDFVANNVNLLNVSVSRAKKLYIHVGDKNILRSSAKKPMIKYLSHFDEKGIFFNYKEIALKKTLEELNLEKIKEKILNNLPENKINQISKYLYVLKNLKIEDEYFYNSKDIANKMCELISNAKQSILFIVPWIRESALEYIQKNADLTKIKNGKVKVNFRVLYNKSEKYKLKKIYSKLKEVFNISDKLDINQYIDEISIEHGTHEKIMIVDREKIFIGSFNFLSSGFYDLDEKSREKINLRDEIAVLKGPYDVWSYIFNRYKTLKVKKEILYKELEKFINHYNNI
jgi:superfamily I DNA and/or RNA helicase